MTEGSRVGYKRPVPEMGGCPIKLGGQMIWSVLMGNHERHIYGAGWVWRTQPNILREADEEPR